VLESENLTHKVRDMCTAECDLCQSSWVNLSPPDKVTAEPSPLGSDLQECNICYQMMLSNIIVLVWVDVIFKLSK